MSKTLKLKKVNKSFIPEPISRILGFPLYILHIHILLDLLDLYIVQYYLSLPLLLYNIVHGQDYITSKKHVIWFFSASPLWTVWRKTRVQSGLKYCCCLLLVSRCALPIEYTHFLSFEGWWWAKLLTI